ncbi:hypothetical protein SacmaDRAFT_0265 [Saccharomonospora marina XMU15]|uniref:Uncharacterized protein n=1 Tax=Saccharomonospora marina XMU15 TaxID=882083 RepID=H5X0B5_9PSEU|nr:hypothetical protein [Saccharomonospora marina]EHR48575.1 hypothetical protein SacmaDRAFT_0265 [Saccharomonospora marina XMU15]
MRTPSAGRRVVRRLLPSTVTSTVSTGWPSMARPNVSGSRGMTTYTPSNEQTEAKLPAPS